MRCGVNGCDVDCPTRDVWEMHVYTNHQEFWKRYVVTQYANN